jgi:hypothetical protein
LRRQYLKRSFIDLSDLFKVLCYSSGKNYPLSDSKSAIAKFELGLGGSGQAKWRLQSKQRLHFASGRYPMFWLPGSTGFRFFMAKAKSPPA